MSSDESKDLFMSLCKGRIQIVKTIFLPIKKSQIDYQVRGQNRTVYKTLIKN